MRQNGEFSISQFSRRPPSDGRIDIATYNWVAETTPPRARRSRATSEVGRLYRSRLRFLVGHRVLSRRGTQRPLGQEKDNRERERRRRRAAQEGRRHRVPIGVLQHVALIHRQP